MSDNWSEEELKAAVETYVDMRNKVANGISFVKKHCYTKLASKYARTEKSFEYRMQNISYVYSLMGRDWVPGIKPAKNVGTNNAEIIERLIFEVEGHALPKVAEFEAQVVKLRANKTLGKPQGIMEPEKNVSSVTNYRRDPKVKAWVLINANGFCECCNDPAPFTTVEGEPFLEVHHLRRLADGGSDTVSNSLALCPNCHREMHYGINKVVLVQSMYTKIKRLMHE